MPAPSTSRSALRFMYVLLLVLFLGQNVAWPAEGTHSAPQVDREYAALETLVRDTPVEQMDERWLLDRIYRPHAEPQKHLKRILGSADLAAKNERMARLRQAYDLGFWFWLAREKGWVIELTNQGKANGHRSDLDQTGWVIAGPEANRPKNFKEVQRLWEEYHGKHSIKPSQPDMTLFNGDQFLPDWKNARLAGDEFVTRLAGTVLELRQDAEAYYVPGANKEQVHKRALAEGRTLHIAWDHESGWPVINGKPFDLDAYRQGKRDLMYLRAEDIAVRYRGVHPDAPWRYALGNLAQNIEKFLGHITDPISRQKYANRILDGAFSRILGIAQKDGLGGLQEYYKVHIGNADPAVKRAFKEQFVRQLYGGDMKRDRMDELVRIFDISMDIEADKALGRAEYDPQRYYAEYMSEAAANLRQREPELKGEELRTRALDEAERIFIQKQLQAFAEGAGKVLAHAVRQDFGPEGRLVNRAEFVGSKADYEALAKRQAERQVEVALLFEVVERIDNTRIRDGLRSDLIDAAGDSPALRKLFTQFSELGQAGRQAMDDWLRASAREGRLVSPEDFYKRVGDQVERVVGNLDEAAAKAPKQVSLTRTNAAVASALGPQRATRRQQAIEFLKTAKGMGSDFGEYYWGEFVDGLNFFFFADTATNVIRSYEQGCLRAGVSGTDCGWRIASDTATSFFWGLPLIENYGGAVTSLMAINQGDAGGFFSLTMALAPRLGIGGSVMPIYAVYKLGAGLYEISYTFVVETLDEDLLEQALKSLPVAGDPRARRCDPGGTLKADRPAYPLFAGGKNRIPVPADQWTPAQREQAARAQFGPAIDRALIAQGLKPGTGAWTEASRRLVAKYACELPYYQRMAGLYPHLSPQLERYIAEARARGRDMDDLSFPVMDACVDRENKQREEARAQAATRGKGALEDWEQEEAGKPSPISVCLPRGIEASSAVLRPFMTRQVHDWLKGQPEAYQDEFSTTVERATEGNRFVESLRNMGRALGIVDEDSSRNRLIKQLTDTLIREYVLSQHTHERKNEFDREMARQMAGLAAQVKKAERVLRAQVAGELALGGQFVDLTAKAAADRFARPLPPIRPTLALRLPPYPVRLGEDFMLNADVRGEHGAGGETAPANAWAVEYVVTPLDAVKEGAPADLVITPDVARDLAIQGRAVYTLKAKVLARLRDNSGQGRVLAEDQAELILFDIRNKAGKPGRRDEPAAPPPSVSLADILDKMRQQERAAADASKAARERCNDAQQLARQAEADLKGLESSLGEMDARTRALRTRLDQARTMATEAERWSKEAYTALQSIGEARKRADFAAATACDGLAAIQRAANDTAKRQGLQAIVSAVQRCKGEMQAVNQAEQAAKNAARQCNQVRQSVPLQLSVTTDMESQRKKLDAAGAKVAGDLAGVRTAQAQARDNLGRATQARQQAGTLAEAGKKRLEAETDKAKIGTLIQEMEAILRSMDGTRRGVEGCPDQVTDALSRAEQAAQAAAERALAAQAQADEAEKQMQEGKPFKDADASCRSAQSSADTAALLAESARAMCQDGATCQVIAEDLVAQRLVATVPSVIGLSVDGARARLAQAGLRAGAIRTGDPAPEVGREGTVQGQSPGPGQEAPADGTVTLQLWGAPDQSAILAATDCSVFPGSVPAWNPQTNKPACACPGGTAISTDGGRCINCAEYEARFAAAVNSSRLVEAAGWLDPAQNCPWFGRAASALRHAQDDQQRQQRFELDCLALETNILAALNSGNLRAAQSMLARARHMNCPMNPSTEQFVRWAESQRPVLPPGPAPPGPVREVRCNDTAKSGGNKPETVVVDLGQTSGVFRFDFDMYSVPDRMIVHYGGGTYDTGCTGGKQGRGRDKGSVDLRFFGSNRVTIQVQPSCQGGSTSWRFTVHCPR